MLLARSAPARFWGTNLYQRWNIVYRTKPICDAGLGFLSVAHASLANVLAGKASLRPVDAAVLLAEGTSRT